MHKADNGPNWWARYLAGLLLIFFLLVGLPTAGLCREITAEKIRQHVETLLPAEGEGANGAKYLYKWDVPIRYRLAGAPLEREMEELSRQLKELNIDFAPAGRGKANFYIVFSADVYSVMMSDNFVSYFKEAGESEEGYKNRVVRRAIEDYAVAKQEVRDIGAIRYDVIVVNIKNMAVNKAPGKVNLSEFVMSHIGNGRASNVLPSARNVTGRANKYPDLTEVDLAYLTAMYSSDVVAGGDLKVEREKIIKRMQSILVQ